MKKIMILAGFLALLLLPVTPVAAETVFEKACKEKPSAICNQVDPGKAQVRTDKFITDVVSTLMFALGAISVIMIIVGGIRYAVSEGDANKVSSAKNTILYAVVGLVVAILAYTIVNFVLERF